MASICERSPPEEGRSGVYAQTRFGFGFRVMSIYAKLAAGIHRPDLLARTAQLTGAGEADITPSWRTG